MFLPTPLTFTPEQFKKYLSTLPKASNMKAICLHHTASPTLLQRPQGFSKQHLINLQSYYKGLGWKSCPAIFVDDTHIHVLSEVLKPGNHAVSFNSYAIGIEVLGDYDVENPQVGRGLECWKTAIKATQILSDAFQIPINEQTILFHRDDPKTNKTCPGKKVTKEWILDIINFKPTPPQTPLPKPPINPNQTQVLYVPSSKSNVLKRIIHILVDMVTFRK